MASVTACGPSQTGPARPGPGYPTRLTPPAELEGDFAMEQEVTMRHPRGENSFRAVLQKTGERLVLLGLAPHGGRAFMIEQIGDEVSFESFMPMELPFPGRYILHDIHRTWFPAADPEEEVRVERDADRITRRVFTRRDGEPAGEIEVRYQGGLAQGAPLRAEPPSVVVLDNRWFGYRATVRTISWQPL